MGGLKYPECRRYKGRDKVLCLLESIERDYRQGRISQGIAEARMKYLVALNRANHWMGERELVRLIDRYLERIGAKPLYSSPKTRARARELGIAVATA
jgi:hypothetical protein